MTSEHIHINIMEKLKFIGIIPARYASTRFPGKPLARIGSMTMIERVWRQVGRVLGNNVWVATDDSRIYDAVAAFGGNAVMTSTEHRSGTDRCREAYEKVGSGEDVVINIQGDEPFIEPRQIEAVMQCFDDPATDIATLVRAFDPAGSYEVLADPNTPKVVVDNGMNAIYFSRSVIPYLRNVPVEKWPTSHTFYTHVGMYAYRATVLDEITRLPQSGLELAESLEQLRWLQSGYRIKVGVTDCSSIGIDTPQDLENAIKLLGING